MFRKKCESLIQRHKKARYRLIFPLYVLLILFLFLFAVINFQTLYRQFLNLNPDNIEQNMKITNDERKEMDEKHIKNGWFGYLYTDDNQINLPLYAGYAQWILNAGFGEVPTPQAKVGSDNFCVASHEYLVNGAYTNYGFSQLQFETHKGEIFHVDTPQNEEYDYQVVDKTVKDASTAGDIVNKDYNTKELHLNTPTMMCYTCYSPSRFDPLQHPTKRVIVTTVLKSHHRIKKIKNRFFTEVKKQGSHAPKGFLNKLCRAFLDFWFKTIKLQHFLNLDDNGQVNAF